MKFPPGRVRTAVSVRRHRQNFCRRLGRVQGDGERQRPEEELPQRVVLRRVLPLVGDFVLPAVGLAALLVGPVLFALWLAALMLKEEVDKFQI